MQDDILFRVIVLVLFIGIRFVRWRARHLINWQASWPSMKRHPFDTSVLMLLSLCWMMAVGIYIGFPRLVSTFTVPIPTWVRAGAVVAAAAGLALLWWADTCLGENLSVTLKIRSDHTLVTRGPYSKIRHPIYCATLIYAAAVGIVTANYVLGALIFVPMATLVAQRLGREEQLMVDHFGDNYRVYMRRTGRLVPRWWR